MSIFEPTTVTPMESFVGPTDDLEEIPETAQAPPKPNSVYLPSVTMPAFIKSAEGNLATPVDYTTPPTSPDGKLPIINFRVTVFKVDKVNTKNETANIKIGVVFHWTDPRVCGWDEFLLPASLWGPELHLYNGIDCIPEYEHFVIFKADEGRLKRFINYHSTISCPMKLGHFPFDSQIVEAHFVNISHWRTLNLERHGSSPNKELYRLAPVSRQTEGQFFKSYFDGAIMEFTLLHNRALLEEPDRETPGALMINHLKIQFDMERTESFYIWKAFTPLYLLTTVSFLTLAVEPRGEESLASKLELSFTMFLAAVALQTMIAESVPKVDFLTTIDWVAFASIISVCAVAFFSVIVEKLNTLAGYSWRTCRRVNGKQACAKTVGLSFYNICTSVLGAMIFFVVYTLLIAIIILPSWKARIAHRLERVEKKARIRDYSVRLFSKASITGLGKITPGER